jgi:hypothetical protein
MVEFFLFILSVFFSLVGIKLILLKTGNHDTDLFMKIIGLILFIPSIYIVLETLKIIK